MSSENIILKTDQTTNHLILRNKNSSTPTLFLHGFTGIGSSWNEVISKINYHSIALDIVGHGKSTFNNLESDYSIDDWCEDFNEILRHDDIN